MPGRLAWFQRPENLLLLALIAVAAGLRFSTLGLQSYDHDETVTAGKILQPGLGDTLSGVLAGERSPPLFYIVAWAWSRIFGTGEVALRSLSAIAGTLTVPAAYAAATTLVSRRAGLITGALVAVNPALIWYSQQARSYAAFVFLATLGFCFFARALRHPDPKPFAWWAAVSSLAVATHYFAAFLVAVEGLWLLCATRLRRAALAAVAVTAAVGLGLVPVALMQQGTGRRDLFANAPLGERIVEVARTIVTGVQGSAGTPLLGLLQRAAVIATVGLLLVAAVVLIRGADSRSRRGALVGAAVGVGALAIPIAAAVVGFDFFKPRNLVGSTVPLIMVLGVVLATWKPPRLATAAVVAFSVLLAAISVVTFRSPPAQRFNWRGVAALVGEPSGPRILACPRAADDPLRLYLRSDPILVFSKKQRVERLPGGQSVTAFRTNEIVVLTSRGEGRNPLRGFRLTKRQSFDKFDITRWRAPRPLPVDLAALNMSDALPTRHSVLVDGVGPTAGER